MHVPQYSEVLSLLAEADSQEDNEGIGTGERKGGKAKKGGFGSMLRASVDSLRASVASLRPSVSALHTGG